MLTGSVLGTVDRQSTLVLLPVVERYSMSTDHFGAKWNVRWAPWMAGEGLGQRRGRAFFGSAECAAY